MIHVRLHGVRVCTTRSKEGIPHRAVLFPGVFTDAVEDISGLSASGLEIEVLMDCR
jgi:hypothetical protein